MQKHILNIQISRISGYRISNLGDQIYEFRSLTDTDYGGCDLEVRGTNWERNGDLDLKGTPRPYLQEKQRPGIGGRTRHPDWAEVELGT